MKNTLKQYSILFCILFAVFSSSCKTPVSSPDGGIRGVWKITAITYRTLDQSYAYGGWLVIFADEGTWGGLITKRDLGATDELYGRYSYDLATPETIYIDLSGMLNGFETPRQWDIVRGNPETDKVFAIHGTKYIAENPFETSITLERVATGTSTIGN